MICLGRTAVLFCGLCIAQLVNADCRLRTDSTQVPNAQELLDRLKPLYGETFSHQYKDDLAGGHAYNYTMRICDGVQIGNKFHSNEIGVVQEDNSAFVSVGSVNYTIIKGGTDWIMLTYTKGKRYGSHCNGQNRQAHIMIVCDPYSLKGEFRVIYEETKLENESGCFYMMELSSKVACSSHQTGLSSGSIFLIVFFTIAGAYLIFGAIYKRCVYGSKGLDQIPNVGFWKTCGSLQADGCDYLCRCTGSGYNSNKPFQGVADDQLDEEIDDEHLLPM